MSSIHTPQVMSSRDFNQDTAGAKKAAARAPLVITDRGTPTHVLVSYERYLELTGGGANIVQLLSMPEAAMLEFEPARAEDVVRAADLS